MPSTPYVVASGGAASASSLVLSVLQTTSNGDNIIFGITINTANAVPSVADTQGNTYIGYLSDTTETGAQLWIFEAHGAAQLVQGVDTITISVSQP